ncbi:UNKNOWN [Stylonychia lemnae]|uniref:Uncharacterized protein n=1 Tax=Stylonychia lemnae TaxID=5949 RepID=A0A078BBL2_STYLE|nr:UNKNOWN [Stylonychia lemnae]|eukprot:CDW91784.1 UNKNOWN [Stylonychia lemnae]
MVNCSECLQHAFPMYLGGFNNQILIKAMSVDDATQQIVIAGINYDSDIAIGTSSSGYPFIAYIDEGNIYRWAYVFSLHSVQLDKVIFSKGKKKVIAINYLGIALQTDDNKFMLTIIKQDTGNQINVLSVNPGQARLLAQCTDGKGFYVAGLQDDYDTQQLQSSISIFNTVGVLQFDYLLLTTTASSNQALITHMYVTQKGTWKIDSIYGIICSDLQTLEPKYIIFLIEVGYQENYETNEGTQMYFEISSQSKSFVTSAGISSKYGVIIAGHTNSSDQGLDLNFQKNVSFITTSEDKYRCRGSVVQFSVDLMTVSTAFEF